MNAERMVHVGDEARRAFERRRASATMGRFLRIVDDRGRMMDLYRHAWFALVLAAAGIGCTKEPQPESTPVSRKSPATIREIEAQRDSLDKTLWAEEVQAERYRETFVQLWDQLLKAQEPFDILANVPFEELRLGVPGPSESLGAGLTRVSFGAGGRVLDSAGWQTLLTQARAQYRVVYTDWQHQSFEADTGGEPRSVFAITFHLVPRTPGSKVAGSLVVRGNLGVEWSSEEDQFLNKKPRVLDASAIEVLEWRGEPAFKEVLHYEAPGHKDVPPVLAYDLDGDGLSEIIFPGTNVVQRNRGKFRFEASDFCAFPLKTTFEAVIADFDGDGRRDYLAAGLAEGDATAPSLYLYVGDASDGFQAAPVRVFPNPFEGQVCFAVGDVEQDGDLDLYVGKYVPPYVGGQMPTPFYDANDSKPANLLLNDGSGHFTDGIVGSGLEAKRFRRTFRTSFVDFDGDGDLDLLTTNDFAGADLFTNDGAGHFTDATRTMIDEPANFGMSHTLADYDRDGRLDLYVTGMYSYTVRRLEQMGLARADVPEVKEHRMPMGYGNRLYFGQDGGRYVQPSIAADVANSGWSWGTTSLDVDGDGDPDLYVANGHVSGDTVRDYDSRYWRHDIHLGSSKMDPVLSAYFLEIMRGMGRAYSWSGFEHNRLFLNGGQDGFIDVAHLLGVAFDQESRCVIAEDFDRDGRCDLLVSYLDRKTETKGFWVLANAWPEKHPWVGVELLETARHPVLGARIDVVTAGGSQTALVIAGDSFFSQQSNSRVFGLGQDTSVQKIVVTWPGGAKSELTAPSVGKVHRIEAPTS